MIVCILTIVAVLPLAVHGDACYSWSYTDVIFIKAHSLAESAILDRAGRRSFVECCATCDVPAGCAGVAFREGECIRFDGTAASGFVTSLDGSREDYKVMLHNIATTGEMEFNCEGSCERCPELPKTDCKAHYESGARTNGAYSLANGATVYCDMADGGWTVFLRRVDSSWDFKRTYSDYVSGFGVLSGNLWVGLDTLHAITAGAGVASELHVYMDTFEGESAWASYSTFSVGAAASSYPLTVSGYSGTAGDAMSYHNGRAFTTIDHDVDGSGSNCASLFHGGWWYNSCHYCNPTGHYLGGAGSLSSQGATWSQYKGQSYSLKTFIFKVRRY